MMKRARYAVAVLIVSSICVLPVSAQSQRLIVRNTLGLPGLTKVCLVLNCNVVRSLGDPLGQVFLVSVPNGVNLNTILALLPRQLGIVDVELDQVLSVIGPTLDSIPSDLSNNIPETYYGNVVWRGYLTQPANQIIRTAQAQTTFHVSGSGVVAIIDTGVDPTHPALLGVVLQGYDFTRNQAGADEKGDIDHSTVAVLDGGPPQMVTPSVAAAVSNQTAAILSQSQYAGFGHGTMTTGLVHLLAPTAKLLPLKAFKADGTGYASDVIRAIYYATNSNAKVINMSFSFADPSTEMSKALAYVNGKAVICVAAAGNNGEKIMAYPASYPYVMGVGSTSNSDLQSTFTNYGSQVLWVAAPGEQVMSTYPFGTYASSSGTSFSSPQVSGTADLLTSISGSVNQSRAAAAIAHAKWLSTNLNNGRLDAYQAVAAWAEAANSH